ncbi:hypothetical protein GpartN1_g4091.t1 [Galdieria partita]|uniref:Integral membrane bound transporter domain-containing protein n=1 Tax=Galdieria partita TaxID=83374 RepID=A0A9C7PXJ3_9RHOD|nr:hypothetical protein GpartN1_g4091.t1 [Galdieria partita]
METKRLNFYEQNFGDWAILRLFQKDNKKQVSTKHLSATDYWLQKKATKFQRWRYFLTCWFRSVPFRMAVRSFFGIIFAVLFVFIPKLFSVFPDAPLAVIYYIINLTVLVQELHLGIVIQASCLTAVALVFGACFGALGAFASRESVGITIIVALIGTALFTMLHSDPRVAGMVYYTGEINFMFNLLDTRTLGNESILYTMRITLVASGLSLLFSLIPAIFIFPRFSAWDMKICIRDALRNVGASMSSVSSILLDPVVSVYQLHGIASQETANDENMERSSSGLNSFQETDSIQLETQLESYSSPSGSFSLQKIDPFKRDWMSGCSYSLKFLESIMEGHHLIAARANISRARRLVTYCSFEPNIAQMLRKEPTALWGRILDATEDLIGKVDSLRSVIDGGRRKYTSDTLMRWYDMVPILKEMFAILATFCQKTGECVCMKNMSEQLNIMSITREQLLRLEDIQKRLRDSLQYAYMRYWDTTSRLGAESTALELGPLMFVIVLSKSILESSIHVEEELVHLIVARHEKSLRRGYLNLFGWTRSLFWSFETWFQIMKSFPRQRSQWMALLNSMEFHYFMKKWIGEMIIIIIFLTTPLYKYVTNFDGLWLWMSFMIYFTPTVEGTLIGGLITILGCGFGCIIGFLLMNWKASAMEPYGLAAVIVVVTTVCVYFMNGPYYVALLTTCTTLYTMILYQYSPTEYKAVWHYPLARFVNISLGIVIAIVFSEFIFPHSSLMEARQRLAAAMEKMNSWQSWLLSRYFRAVGYHRKGTVVSGTIQVKPLDYGEDANVLVIEETSGNDVNQLEPHSTSNVHEISPTDDSKSKQEKDLIDWRASILRDLQSSASWIQSVQNGVASQLHAIPRIVAATAEREEMLLARLTAFSTVLEYEPFLTGQFQYGHYHLFIQPLVESIQALQEVKKQLVQVIVSCIMEGKPFTSLAFLREFGYASVRNTATAAWLSKDYFEQAGSKVLGSLYSGIHHYAEKEMAQILSYTHKGKEEVWKATQVMQGGLSHFFHEMEQQFHHIGTNLFHAEQNNSNGQTEEHVQPNSESHFVSLESPHMEAALSTLGDIFQQGPDIETNTSNDMEVHEHHIHNRVNSSTDSSKEILNSAALDANASMERDLSSTSTLSSRDSKVENRAKMDSLKGMMNRQSSLKPKEEKKKHRNGFSWIIHHALNTGTKRFGTVGNEMLHSLTEFLLGDEQVPPIVHNLRQGAHQIRLAQANFYANYLKLEHSYYSSLMDQKLNKAEIDKTNHPFHSLYDIPYIRCADDHILFLASFFIFSYVIDGIKSLATAIADAFSEDMEEIRERHQLLIKKEMNKLQKKQPERKGIYHRRRGKRLLNRIAKSSSQDE